MTGAQIIIESLKRQGVSLVFAYPGATSMPLHQALLGTTIRVLLPRHEQGGIFAAEGYARACGAPGVCIATSGPGATNLVTGIADAYMDSVPLVVITAQVSNIYIGKNAFQETDIIGLTRPVVKHSFLVLNTEELPEVICDAFAIATQGRPGPVVIDVPYNFLLEECADPVFPEQPNLRALPDIPPVSPIALRKLRLLLRNARRPCVYAGGGILAGHAEQLLLRFAEKNQIPVATSLMGVTAFPPDHPLSLRWLGMYGNQTANQAIQECDLLLGMGVRFSDRVTGDPRTFAPKATVVHLDIDPSEINKNKTVDLAIVGDLADLLASLNRSPSCAENHRDWLRELARRQSAVVPAVSSPSSEISGAEVVCALNALTKGNAIVATGVGQHQMWVAQHYAFRQPRHLLCSGGLGAMGFGLPAAIGAKLACPREEVILVDGDGSFQMNIQELATVFAENLPLKMVILDNQMLGMVAQWEDLLCGGRHAHTDMTVSRANGPYPSFAAIAQGYGIPSKEVFCRRDLLPALRKMRAVQGPFLCVVHTRHHEHCQIHSLTTVTKNQISSHR